MLALPTFYVTKIKLRKFPFEIFPKSNDVAFPNFSFRKP